jgi:hypothetical protein
MLSTPLIGLSASARRKKPVPQPLFRPTLEALEARLTPSGIYTWKGGDAGTPTAWTDTNNWTIVNGNHAYPGANNSTDDQVVFDNNATTNAVLNQSISLDGLTLKTNYSQALMVVGGNSITLEGVSATGGFFEQGGALTLKSASWIALGSDGNKAAWTGGDLSSTGDAGANIYVYGGTSLLINSNASTLGANLIIGENQKGADSAGTVNIADPTFQSGLASNVVMYQGAGMTIHPYGILNFNQSVNSNTKGGIAVAQGQTSNIDNQGRINRLGNDSTNWLNINAKVVNSASTSIFFTGKNTLTDVSANGFWLNAGELQRTKGSNFKGLQGVLGGGLIRVVDNGPPGRFNVYFADNLNLASGSIVFSEAPGDFANLDIGGNLSLGDGVSVSVNVDGSTAGSGDVFNVGGTTTIGDATLNIYTENAAVAMGSFYTFINSASWNTADTWEVVNNTGSSASWYLYTTGELMNI